MKDNGLFIPGINLPYLKEEPKVDIDIPRMIRLNLSSKGNSEVIYIKGRKYNLVDILTSSYLAFTTINNCYNYFNLLIETEKVELTEEEFIEFGIVYGRLISFIKKCSTKWDLPKNLFDNNYVESIDRFCFRIEDYITISNIAYDILCNEIVGKYAFEK